MYTVHAVLTFQARPHTCGANYKNPSMILVSFNRQFHVHSYGPDSPKHAPTYRNTRAHVRARSFTQPLLVWICVLFETVYTITVEQVQCNNFKYAVFN